MHGLFRIFERTCGDCGNAPGLPSTSDKAFSYAFVLRPLGGTANPEAVEATRRASELFYKGRIDDALHQFHRAQALAPRAYQAYSNLGSAYHERADDDEALSWYRQAHRLAPRDSIATLALALLEQRCGQVEESQWLLVNFLQEVNPSHVDALRQLAQLYETQKSWSRAAGCYKRLMQADPDNDEWCAQLTMCQMRLQAQGRSPPRNQGLHHDSEHYPVYEVRDDVL
mmetsp:Transcript_20664/g.34366  ORF Transcript_20664/g.34366 Transcript_20664/m.34366 type:complete len:227 (-) Transcript_20664:247-927(-)